MKALGRFLAKLLCLGLAFSLSGCGQDVSREDESEVAGQESQEGEMEETQLSFGSQGAFFDEETTGCHFFQLTGRRGIMLTDYSHMRTAC